MDKKDEIIAALRHALNFYAAPLTYHAMSIRFDPPCGGFREDFSDDHGDEFYDRAMPGALARKVLRGVETGDFSEIKCDQHETPLKIESVMFCEECSKGGVNFSARL